MNPRAINRGAGECGYTLLELMVVIFLITLIVGLSSFFYTGISSSSKLNSTVRGLSASIRHSGYASLVKGESKSMMIDLDSKRYGIDGHNYRSIPAEIDIRMVDPITGEARSGMYRSSFRSAGGMRFDTIVLSNKKRDVKIEFDPVVGSVVVK